METLFAVTLLVSLPAVRPAYSLPSQFLLEDTASPKNCYTDTSGITVRWRQGRRQRISSRFSTVTLDVNLFYNETRIGATQFRELLVARSMPQPVSVDALLRDCDNYATDVFDLALVLAQGLQELQQRDCLYPGEVGVEFARLYMTRAFAKDNLWSAPINAWLARRYAKHQHALLCVKPFPLEFELDVVDGTVDVETAMLQGKRLPRRIRAMQKYYHRVLGVTTLAEDYTPGVWMAKTLRAAQPVTGTVARALQQSKAA